MQPSNYSPIPDLLIKFFGQVSVKLLSCPISLISPIRALNKFNIFCALIRSDLSWTTRSWLLYESVDPAGVKPIDPPTEVAPSRAIKPGYLVMANTQEQTFDRHHPNVTPERDSGPRSAIQLVQRAIFTIGHVRLTRHTWAKAYYLPKRERNRLFNQTFFLANAIILDLVHVSWPAANLE
jgi:hypothetical protein